MKNIINIITVIIALYSGIVAVTATINYIALPVFIISIIVLFNNTGVQEWL